MDDRIDKSKTPLVFYHIRSLFSGDKQPGKTSALTWFDLHDKETPFSTARNVFDSMRTYWADDFSSEKALAKYRSHKQGSMRARDLASELSSLANSVHSMTISSEDRKATFIAALNPSVWDYVRSNLTILKIAVGRDPTLEEVIQLAARTDDLEGFKRPSSSTTSAPRGSSSLPSNGPKSVPERSASGWKDRATSWQEKNPMAKKNDWFNAKSSSSDRPVRCYNCGEMATHYSTGCMNPRKNPSTVVVASFRIPPSYSQVVSTTSARPGSTSSVSDSREPTVADLLGLDEGSGKGLGQ